MYVYGYVRAEDAADLGAGIDDGAVTTIAEGGVAALVTAAEDVRPRRATLLAHVSVLDRALERGPVLPLRFGMLAEEDAVRASLRDADLRRRLDALDGMVEMALGVSYREDVVLREVLAENPSVAAMRERIGDRPPAATHFERIRLGEMIAQAIDAKRAHDAGAIIAAVEPHVADFAQEAPKSEHSVLDGACLVARERLGDLDDVLEQISRERAERMQFRLLGPRPPHSFVERI